MNALMVAITMFAVFFYGANFCRADIDNNKLGMSFDVAIAILQTVVCLMVLRTSP